MNVVWKQLKSGVTRSTGVVMRTARRSKQVLFSRYLLATNTAISVCFAGVGDLLQQHYEIARGREESCNFLRTRNIAVTGAPVGAACHYWYMYLDRSLPGRSFKMVGKKIILDQLIGSPVFILIFLVTLRALDKTSIKSKDFWMKSVTLYTAEWLIWPPAQLINFLFLPTRYRVLYDNAISLGFDCYYPYVSYKKDSRKVPSDYDSKKGYNPNITHEGGITDDGDSIEHAGDRSFNYGLVSSLEEFAVCCSCL